jgi:hypothetical protein
MSLKYYLVDNKLTPDPEDCVARVQDVPTLTFEQLIRNMTSRGLTLTDTEVQSVFNEFVHAVNDGLQQGFAIATPFMRIRPGIVGVFANPNDSFDPSRHKVKLNASLGSDILISQQAMKTEKVKPAALRPEITHVKDYQTQQENESISRNGTAEIRGSSLKMDHEDPEQGIFIVNDAGETRVSIYIHNKPSQVIFQVPGNLPEGDVRIVVRNKNAGSLVLRHGTFDTALTVI